MTTYVELYTWLNALPALTALVDDRIYPVIVPQGATYPCVRMSRGDDGGLLDLAGQGETISTELDIDCLAETIDDAQAIADTIKVALKNYRGLLDTRYVQFVELTTELDSYEPELGDGKYRVSQAWTLWHN